MNTYGAVLFLGMLLLFVLGLIVLNEAGILSIAPTLAGGGA